MKKNVLFIWIPKTAGTSIVESLGIKRKIDDVLFRKFEGSGWVTFGHVSYSLAVEQNRVSEEFMESAFKFCFVRNPYDRVVSHYVHQLKEDKEQGSFAEHCQKLKRGIIPLGFFHGRGFSGANPQVHWLRNIDVDFIGKFENLQADFKTLCEKLGVEPFELPHMNKLDHKDYRDYYTETEVEVIRELHEEDFDRFNYDRRLV